MLKRGYYFILFLIAHHQNKALVKALPIFHALLCTQQESSPFMRWKEHEFEFVAYSMV